MSFQELVVQAAKNTLKGLPSLPRFAQDPAPASPETVSPERVETETWTFPTSFLVGHLADFFQGDVCTHVPQPAWNLRREWSVRASARREATPIQDAPPVSSSSGSMRTGEASRTGGGPSHILERWISTECLGVCLQLRTPCWPGTSPLSPSSHISMRSWSRQHCATAEMRYFCFMPCTVTARWPAARVGSLGQSSSEPLLSRLDSFSPGLALQRGLRTHIGNHCACQADAGIWSSLMSPIQRASRLCFA